MESVRGYADPRLSGALTGLDEMKAAALRAMAQRNKP
jgi:hypothetical protein